MLLRRLGLVARRRSLAVSKFFLQPRLNPCSRHALRRVYSWWRHLREVAGQKKKKHLYTDAERPTIKEQAGEKMARRKKPAEEAQKRGLGQRRSKNEPPENSRGGPKTMPGSPEPGRQGGGWPATCMPAFLSWKSGSYTLHHTPNSKRPSLHAYLSQA